MAIITDITPQTKDKTRVNVYLDGRFFCALDFVTLAENRLKKGMEITESALSVIQLESEREKAFQKAVSLISASAKTERQMVERLKEKGYTYPMILETVARLKEYGYIDDGEYAREYVLSHAHKKGHLLMAAELKAKGVKDADIEAALAEVNGLNGAKTVLTAYLRGKKITVETLQKAYRHLMMKGFLGEDVSQALQDLKQEVADEDEG